MPNTKPVVDNADVVRYVHHKAESVGLVHVLQVGAVTKGQQGEELADIKEMVEAGSPAISEDGKSVMNSLLARDAMQETVTFRYCHIAKIRIWLAPAWSTRMRMQNGGDWLELPIP